MAAPRSAALKLDWAKVTTSLGLRGQTAASLQAFKQRNENARRRVAALQEQATTVDFAHYRSILKNQAVVDEVERRFKEFKPAAYDVQRQLKAIDAFEVEAVRNAEQTKEKVDLELQDLQKTLKNIEEARPFDELTVEEVAAAEPSIDEKTAKLVSKGRWSVPGYKLGPVRSYSPVLTIFASFGRLFVYRRLFMFARDKAVVEPKRSQRLAALPFQHTYEVIHDSGTAV
ncbi:hypothetical protein DL769_006509 [Monosporascus sp. CRB-8-3]|nr:hypothetical protein DL769_006509 [Monosporascus sp. CRB-8-3]